MPAKVLIVDDSAFVRTPHWEVPEGDDRAVGEAENGVEAPAAVQEADPDANVITCASVGQEEMVGATVRAGADGCHAGPLKKPTAVRAVNDVVPAQ